MFNARKDLTEAEIKSQLEEGIMAMGYMIKLSKEAHDKALAEGYDKKQAMEIAKFIIERIMIGK